MASNFYDVRPSTSRDANELSFPIKTSSSSENIQSHNQKPKKSYLSLATGGFGLREKETEEEKRKREQENIAYALFGKRCKKEYDETKNEYNNKDYDKELINHFNNSSLNTTNDNEKHQIGSDYIPLSKFKAEFEEADQDDLEIYHDPHYNLLNPNYNMNLPIYKWRKSILDSIRTNNVIIIQGNTGCGKTTQVPQYILDYYASINKKCNIIVTQPRRLAAISIARRVCEERGWNLGSICGYRIARDAKVSPVTKISYVTTGFLLAQAIGLANALNSYTHIVLDEVHDRELDIDLIILIVKILLIAGYKGKIILMSATLNPEELENYFDNVSIKKKVDLVKCSYELHKVKQYYLNEIKSCLNSDVKKLFIFICNYLNKYNLLIY
jgi:ATP-dependent RNA helicase TDRD9